MTYLLALDQGTTSSRAILFNRSGEIIGISQEELPQYYPQSGWVEHDPIEIWETQVNVARDVMRRCDVRSDRIVSIGITNQRETTLVWDRQTGRPIHHAIVWQDRRTAPLCDAMRTGGHEAVVRRKTGLIIDPYFCATKLRWLLDQVPDSRQRADRGELAFGTVDSWLIWNLTGGRVHATDLTNASRTMLLNIETGQWDDELLALFDIPKSMLPKVFSSSGRFGKTEPSLFGGEISIGGAAGDQQAALFGQNCTRTGMAKNTYGTGCFALMNIGETPRASDNRLLTTIACGTAAKRQYALEGSVFVAGAAVQWLRDGLGIIRSSADVEALAASVPDSDGLYLVPAFAGLGAPHWDSYARGAMIGISRGTTAAHIARATLEGIAFQVADVLDAMGSDAGKRVTELRVDGGASNNDLLMQFQADILGIDVVRPKIVETTALGAAFLAGLSSGFWKNLGEIESVWKTDRVFTPRMSADEARNRRDRWNEALKRSMHWADPQ